jgi:hypothetical protein
MILDVLIYMYIGKKKKDREKSECAERKKREFALLLPIASPRSKPGYRTQSHSEGGKARVLSKVCVKYKTIFHSFFQNRCV